MDRSKGESHRGYYWVDEINNKLVLLIIEKAEEGRPQELLKNFKGYLQTDGYGVYDALMGKE
ncbi:MAG: transposase [Bacteroidetes bacterium]|nr:transposase [Bacteroidota bacterium]